MKAATPQMTDASVSAALFKAIAAIYQAIGNVCLSKLNGSAMPYARNAITAIADVTSHICIRHRKVLAPSRQTAKGFSRIGIISHSTCLTTICPRRRRKGEAAKNGEACQEAIKGISAALSINVRQGI